MYMANRSEVRRRRIAAGLNQKELSIKAGLPVNAIFRIETGENQKTQFLRAREIARALGCQVHDIFFVPEK